MKHIIGIILIIGSVFIINNLIHAIYNLWQKEHLLVKAQRELERVKYNHEQLRQQLALVQNPHFVEEEARNKLLLVKPGEQLVVLPQELVRASKSAEAKPGGDKAIWQQWIELFF